MAFLSENVNLDEYNNNTNLENNDYEEQVMELSDNDDYEDIEEYNESPNLSVNNNDLDDDDIPTKLQDFIDEFDKFKLNVISNYKMDKKVQQAASTLTGKLKKANNGNHETFRRHLFQLGQDPSIQKQKGKKKKNRGIIPIQSSARARRKFRHRGNAAAPAGRKVKEPIVQREMVVNDDDENVYYAVPSKTKHRKAKQKHSLNDDILNNRPSAKKH